MYKTIFSSSIIHNNIYGFTWKRNHKTKNFNVQNRLVKLIVAYSLGRKLQSIENK